MVTLVLKLLQLPMIRFDRVLAALTSSRGYDHRHQRRVGPGGLVEATGATQLQSVAVGGVVLAGCGGQLTVAVAVVGVSIQRVRVVRELLVVGLLEHRSRDVHAQWLGEPHAVAGAPIFWIFLLHVDECGVAAVGAREFVGVVIAAVPATDNPLGLDCRLCDLWAGARAGCPRASHGSSERGLHLPEPVLVVGAHPGVRAGGVVIAGGETSLLWAGGGRRAGGQEGKRGGHRWRGDVAALGKLRRRFQRVHEDDWDVVVGHHHRRQLNDVVVMVAAVVRSVKSIKRYSLLYYNTIIVLT